MRRPLICNLPFFNGYWLSATSSYDSRTLTLLCFWPPQTGKDEKCQTDNLPQYNPKPSIQIMAASFSCYVWGLFPIILNKYQIWTYTTHLSYSLTCYARRSYVIRSHKNEPRMQDGDISTSIRRIFRYGKNKRLKIFETFLKSWNAKQSNALS